MWTSCGCCSDRGASVDPANRDGMTALILASRRGHVDIVRLLLDRGASVDSTDNKGMDALACCSCSECQTLLRGSERLQQWHRRHSLVTWGHAAVRQRLRSALACHRRESWK
ncbi:hypothetical protein FNF28_05558 [Cafeteria roenbergensis]|uniref:Uncharacterized protein n=1 Tax=Cafeteria roenbergensis TaxID=33653 RepID=A0A5A8D7A7_CAFRO|nr:hypothetical protein FNF28_05558 [Cafeteria roenbergensis]